MENHKFEKVNWSGYPPIEKCTDMGDTNDNIMDEEILEMDDRTILKNYMSIVI